MRILLLNYEFPPLGGGAAPVSYEIAKRLSDSDDFEVDVVTMGYKGLPYHEKLGSRLNVYRVRCWRSKKEICHPWEQATYLISAFFRCWKLIRRHKYDVCHTHFIIPTGILSVLLKKLFGLNYVITTHGSDVPGFNTDRFKMMHKFMGPFQRMVVRGARCVVSPSQYLKSLIVKNIDKKLGESVMHIPNGIEVSRFTPQTKTKTILSAGRLLERKGFQYLIKAVSDEDIGYEVHICGDGPMMEKLKKLAKESKTKVILHGWMNNRGQEFIDLQERAAIYVLASESENGSIALLEGMLAGCAVITTNVSGCPETVGDAGLLINPRDIADLRQKIKDLIRDDSLLQSYQKKARKRVELKFSWDVVIEQYKKALTDPI